MRIDKLIRLSLKEDIGKGDITTDALILKSAKVKAAIIAKESGVAAGIRIAQDVFRALDKNIVCKNYIKDGGRIRKGESVVEIFGNARSILKGERVALNFLSHLSGIATRTNEFVKKIKGTKARIYDTRKTLPGLRELEKYAVRCGGGVNHRMGLYDQILIKDNHIKIANGTGQRANLKDLISEARKKNRKDIKIEIEVKNLSELRQGLAGKPDIIMLDNFKLSQIKKAMDIIDDGQIVEVSGGINLNNIRAIAKTGAQRISIGAITHSAPALDFSLEIIDI